MQCLPVFHSNSESESTEKWQSSLLERLSKQAYGEPEIDVYVGLALLRSSNRDDVSCDEVSVLMISVLVFSYSVFKSSIFMLGPYIQIKVLRILISLSLEIFNILRSIYN